MRRPGRGTIYGWLYIPEMLTWWKRTTTNLIETGCGLLPYPWGDRIEATLGNFVLWVQITLAIVVLPDFDVACVVGTPAHLGCPRPWA